MRRLSQSSGTENVFLHLGGAGVFVFCSAFWSLMSGVVGILARLIVKPSAAERAHDSMTRWIIVGQLLVGVIFSTMLSSVRFSSRKK